MRVTCKRWLLAAVVGAALLAGTAPVSAQVMPYGYRPYGYNGVGPNMNYPLAYPSPMYSAYPATNPAAYSAPANPYAGTASAYSTGATMSSDASSWYIPTYSNPYSAYYSPYGSYLSGAADLVSAQGNYLIAYQKANLLQEEVHRSMLDSRRKVWEEARYERASLMNSEQMRLLDIRNALDRARSNPPQTEIWSGQSLNSLLNYLMAQPIKPGEEPPVPLNEDVLKHINLTNGKDGNIGLLKREINWPATLLRSEFEETRKKLEYELADAKLAARQGMVSSDLVSEIKNNIAKMQDILLQHVSDVQPADYLTAKKYLNMLDESAKALSDPNVTNYITGKTAAKGKNVAELVKNMKEMGVQFAPAAPGDEAAYRALYNAMRDYDAGMTQVSTPAPMKQP
jgi:hypothetical protein